MEEVPTFPYSDSVYIPDPEFDTSPEAEKIRQVGKWQLEPIYKTNLRGKEMVWIVGYDIYRGVLQMTHGQLGGVIRTDERTIQTNTSGKSMNAQAVQEAKTRYNLKHDEGYHRIDEAAPTIKEPMLAQKYKPGSTKLNFPTCYQCKIDGARCLSRKEGDEIIFRSRNNKPYTHYEGQFTDELLKFLEFLPGALELDGEVIVPNTTFQGTISVVRSMVNKHPGLPRAIYCIFDFYIPNVPYEDRYEALYNALLDYNEKYGPPTRFNIVKSFLANSPDELIEMRDVMIERGYEGIVIKKIGASEGDLSKSYYKPGRSSNILKFKTHYSEEGTIIGVKEAQGGNEMGAAVLHVQDPRGNTIYVRPVGSFDIRREWAKNSDEIIGKQVTYNFDTFTADGKPRCPIGIAIRDYE